MSFYGFARIICIFFFRLYFKIEIKGLDHFKNYQNAAVMISNHKSNLDPIFIGLFLKRRLFFMAKKELFFVPILKNIIKKLGAFPVERGNDGGAALEKAIEIVKNHGIVAMFPQGRRCKRIEDALPKTGFVRIALNQEVDIIPCSLGYKRLFPRSRVYINYERPIKISDLLKKEGFTSSDLKFYEVKKITLKLWKIVIDMNKEQEKRLGKI